MKKIVGITVVSMTETYPDTSWMGSYGNEPKSEFAIDRHERGDGRAREYRWFNGPVENYEGATKKEIKKYVEQDYERFEGFNHDQWYFIGIKAKAEIHTSSNGKEWLVNDISSGGLWGIESDCGDEYKKEIGEEQIGELAMTLKEFGFTEEEIDEAKKNVKYNDE